MITNPLIKTGGVPSMKPAQVMPSGKGITKLVTTSDRFGNPGIAKQQFVTRELWDYIPLDGRTSFDFFTEVRNKTFPFTNLQENKLQPGETMILKRYWLAILVIEETEAGVTYTWQPANNVSNLNLTLFNWFNDNVRVVKDKGTLANSPEFNKSGFNQLSNVYTLDSEISIQTEIQFYANIKTVAYNSVPKPGQTVYLGLHVEGIGTILNPKATY
jgi:hypothetical protein